MKITLSIDEHLYECASEILSAVGKTVEQEIVEHLRRLTGDDGLDREIDEFLSRSGQGNSNGWKYNRDDAYERD